MLWMKVRGHYAYYGITGNGEALKRFRYYVKRIWHKWLGRRNQRRMSWERFSRLEKRYPLPLPTTRHATDALACCGSHCRADPRPYQPDRFHLSFAASPLCEWWWASNIRAATPTSTPQSK